MVFSSPIFLFLFLPVLVPLYWVVPKNLKNTVLLFASLGFYAWGEGVFAVVMLASISANWLFGIWIENSLARSTRALVLALAVGINIGLLVVFKYADFLIAQVNAAFGLIAMQPFSSPNLHLPLGISFFTFHSLSYVVDIYRRDAVAQRKPIDFALYISFFPQLIAGPIIRYHDICHQLGSRQITPALLASGVERFVAGLGKKMILANPLGEIADRIFALPSEQLSQPVAWLGIVCYSLQIFLDFSAYSDMAIGLGRIFGFTFLENFNYPYTAQSLQEFWRRWHISLSNWFRDYLYIPLGGNRGPAWRVWFNLVIVFLLCGFWHGANWTFVVWGGLHGTFLVLERLGLGTLLLRLPALLRHGYVALVVMLTWVFFRSTDMASARDYLRALAGLGAPASLQELAGYVDPLAIVALVVGALASCGMFSRLTADWRSRASQTQGQINPPIEALRIEADGAAVLGLRFVLLAVIVLVACSRIAAGTYSPFIYFRF